jgi:hypothetical protein
MEPIKKWLELTAKRKELEAQAEALKDEANALEENIIANLADNCIDSIKVDGRTVYTKRELWASAADGDTARTCEVLKANGFDDYVKETFSTQSLSSYVRELDKSFEGDRPDNPVELLPEVLRPVIKVTEKYRLQSRKA